MKKDSRGFTLIEIMIVVMVIGLLSAIAMPAFSRSRARAKTNVCINNLRQIMTAIEQWALEENMNDGDPADGADYTAIRGGFPECPAGGLYSNLVVGEDPDCDQPRHVLPPF